MTPPQLIAHFDRICDAPNAVPRLRRFILDLAVRGKLISQDPRDEPAIDLLKRILADKSRGEAHGRATQTRHLPPADASDIPFDLPTGWCWTRLGHLSKVVTSGSRDWAKFYSNGKDGAIFVRMGNLSRDSYQLRLGNLQRVKPPADGEGTRTKLEPGDILVSITGEVGLLGLIPPDFGEAYINQHTCLIRPVKQLADRYLPEIFRSQFAQDQFDEPQRGLKNSFRLTDMTSLLVPLPPVAEQGRIVAKLDELMGLCDRLEVTLKAREGRRHRLAAASLHRLSNGEDIETIREQARFYLTHLPRLTTRQEQVKQLRHAVLTLAVRGLLVPQDTNDRPVSEFLRPLKSKASDNWPFPIPSSWAWVSVDQIGECRLGKMLDRAKNKGTPRRYLRNVNVRWFDFDLLDVFEMRFEDDELEEFAVRSGDVLICEGGEPGRAAVWDEREQNIYFQKAIHRVRFSRGVDPHFFVKAIRESTNNGRLSAYFTGVTIKHLTGKGLSSFIVPIPPLAEQRRIVTKVDELMALCDRLEAHLATAQSESRRLLESIFDQALNDNPH